MGPTPTPTPTPSPTPTPLFSNISKIFIFFVLI